MNPRYFTLVVAALLGAAICGCSTSDKSTTRTRTVRPSDFVGNPTPRPAVAHPAEETPRASAATVTPASPVRPAPAPAPRTGDDARLERDLRDATARTNGDDNDAQAVERALDRLPRPVVSAASKPAATRADAEVYTLDAMVGQVNGQAMYASNVFEPIHDQLVAIGRREPRNVFKIRARGLIARRLDEMLLDSLILGEAERDLSSQEQTGLQNILKEQRQDLIRFWGEGSEKLADIRLQQSEGKGVEEVMRDRRQKIVVNRYLQQKLFPKINVTRKDIERYYADHIKDYNPPASRTLRVIRATDAEAADRIDKALADGTPFNEVAANAKLNRYLPDKGGVMVDTGDEAKLFGPEPLNEALAKLGPGQHSPRTKVGETDWWISYESRDEGKGKPLRDVQLDIEKHLREQRFRDLSARYQARLREQGSYNPIDEMADSLLEVAVSRYALPE